MKRLLFYRRGEEGIRRERGEQKGERQTIKQCEQGRGRS